MVARALRGHGQAVALTREPDGEVGDVDALLHLAPALLDDLPHLQRDQATKRVLLLAHGLAHPADELAPLRSRHRPEAQVGLARRLDDLVVLGCRGLPHAADHLAGGRAPALEPGAGRLHPGAAVGARLVAVDAEFAQEVHVVRGVLGRARAARRASHHSRADRPVDRRVAGRRRGSRALLRQGLPRAHPAATGGAPSSAFPGPLPGRSPAASPGGPPPGSQPGPASCPSGARGTSPLAILCAP